MMYEYELNPKAFPVGSVAYFVDKYTGRDNAGNVRWKVDYGIVAEHYPSAICLTKLQPADRRMIDGTPYNDFKTPTEWRKLPKKWSYDCKLFEESVDETLPNGCLIDISAPDQIMKGYERGALVRVQDFDHSKITVQLGERESKGAYRLVRVSSSYDPPPYVSVSWHEVYNTYAEAKEVISTHEAELKRISELSDYDWSVEQIKHTIDRWAGAREDRANLKAAYFTWLMERGDIENIETRLSYGEIQWKHCRNKRWMSIVL